MIGETIAIGAAVVATLTSVGGWVITIRNNAKNQGIIEEKIRNLAEIVGKLPCVQSAEYMKQLGAVTATVAGLSARINQLEANFISALQNLAKDNRRAEDG